MDIIRYTSKYQCQCLQLFDSNLGTYFVECERAKFENFLENYASIYPYFVVEQNGVVVACGGYEQEGEHVTFSWGMVNRSLHGRGIGKKLVEYRLNEILQEYPDRQIKIDTSQLTQGFYEKMGFVAYEVERNGYAAGLDKVFMRYTNAKG